MTRKKIISRFEGNSAGLSCAFDYATDVFAATEIQVISPVSTYSWYKQVTMKYLFVRKRLNRKGINYYTFLGSSEWTKQES